MTKTEYEVQRQRIDAIFKDVWSRFQAGIMTVNDAYQIIEKQKRSNKRTGLKFRYRINKITTETVKEIE